MKEKKAIFKTLAYGKVLFDEMFWNVLKIFLLSDTKKSKEAVHVELLPYIEELRRIYSNGSSEEREAVISEVTKIGQEGSVEKKAAWIAFFQEFVEPSLKKTKARIDALEV